MLLIKAFLDLYGGVFLFALLLYVVFKSQNKSRKRKDIFIHKLFKINRLIFIVTVDHLILLYLCMKFELIIFDLVYLAIFESLLPFRFNRQS